ncbi:dnaJ [Symbiodinium natans]|uniref:DnaJ protein n=1 Tax=Symbiodinium natans TaxID=878477 RepID=A0A812PRX5_9DINO|nr:dnaJ [Symbiodinium natans]
MASKRQERLDFEANDYYAYLNLDSGASEAEVKRHFRQLALQWHPDKHREGPDRTRATDIFQQINKAHEVLSDSQQRSRYDSVWCQKHKGRHRVVPEWAKKAGTGRSGSVEGRAGAGSVQGAAASDEGPGFWPPNLKAGSVDRSAAPKDRATQAYPQRPASFTDGSRFWEGPRPAAACARPPPGSVKPREADGTARRPPPSPAQPHPAHEGSKKPPDAGTRQPDTEEGTSSTQEKPKKGKDPELQKREKERMEAQAAWLRRARTEELRPRTAKKELRRAETVPEEAEFGHIEELRRKMAQQAELIAEQAREVTRRFSDSFQASANAEEDVPAATGRGPSSESVESNSSESADEEVRTRQTLPNEVDAWSRASESMSQVSADMVRAAQR